VVLRSAVFITTPAPVATPVGTEYIVCHPPFAISHQADFFQRPADQRSSILDRSSQEM
jgi:hypothetical protein